jgi:predicted nucleic acid-binding protein
MPEAWDTSAAAGLRPKSSALAYAEDRLRKGDPVAVSASTLNELCYGLRKAALAGIDAAGAQLRWLSEQVDAGLLDVLPFNDRAAELAGALRAHLPIPPQTARQRGRRSKAQSRVAWIMDLQTASTVFVHGYDLATEDAHHAAIAEQIAKLAPKGPPLVVYSPPRWR